MPTDQRPPADSSRAGTHRRSDTADSTDPAGPVVARFGTDVEWSADEPIRSPGRGRLIRRLGVTAGALGCLLILLALIGGLWARARVNGIERVDIAGLAPPAADGSANWLLVGTDSRDGIEPGADGGVFLGAEVIGIRTDTIMVVRIDPTVGTVDLLSVPRDLWVPIAGRGESGRINGAFNGDGGRDRLVATVGSALGIELNRYVEVDFVGFSALIDSVGGVPIWFDTPVRDNGSGLDITEAGCHVLDGAQALAFARARTLETLTADGWRTDPTGDIGRTERQRNVMSQLVRVGSDVGPTDFGTINRVSAQASESLTIGSGAGLTELLGAARAIRNVGVNGIVSHTLPVDDFVTDGGAQVLLLRPAEAESVLERFRGPAPAGPVVFDGSGSETAAEPPGPVGDDGTGSVEVESGVRPTAGHGTFGFDPGPDRSSTVCG